MPATGVIVMLLLSAAPAQGQLERRAASVSILEGRCKFWTGDAGLNASQFVDELKDGETTAITIYYEAGVPKACLAKARRLAMRAGIKDIEVEQGEVDLGPPR